MNQTDPKATFVANVRCDIRHIAKIAKFLMRHGVFVGTKSKIASEAVRIIAREISNELDVKSYIDAEITLRKLGYGDSLNEGTRYFKNLNEMVSEEKSLATIDTEVRRQVKEREESEAEEQEADRKYARPSSKPVTDKEVAYEALRQSGTLAESESEPTPEPELAPEPEHIEMSDRHKQKMADFKAAMIPEGAPLAKDG